MVDKSNNGIPESTGIIFFDGICNLCNRSVDWLIRRDKDRKFKYASLQSDFAKGFLKDRGIVIKDPPESVYLFHNGHIYKKSRAISRIITSLPFLWPVLGSIINIIPSFVADKCYDYIARNRYRWMGTRNKCRVPEGEEKALFYQ